LRATEKAYESPQVAALASGPWRGDSVGHTYTPPFWLLSRPIDDLPNIFVICATPDHH